LILGLLIKNRGDIVSFDSLAYAYWGEDYTDKYSEYTLTKCIQKIRNKLDLNKIDSNCIITVRKKGYMMR
jgi:DNA-binding winged helix-turn-helix (wHTH) protein